MSGKALRDGRLDIRSCRGMRTIDGGVVMTTGETWYSFYTNRDWVILERGLQALAEGIGYHLDMSWFEDVQFFFFFEHEEMLNAHDQYGYHLDAQGKGCFCVELRQVDFHGKASLEEVNGSDDFFIRTAQCHLQKITHCFLTLPAPIEESDFARQVYDVLEKLLGGGKSEFEKE